ncbi:calcium/sodium antiporter [Sagittula salina]|uniref:Calcium/sodium antiporter n=1 Tax=Sagittula salina TaxID=2820268 RepID=A0A940MW21_9RHOB|nr:calcium/sodium antiporter [Sagittula salina]MBP0483914.1 calcium/sodium antiporter [Sagittula salina]
MLDTWAPLLGGLVLLTFGGDILVRGAVALARRLAVSPLMIGLVLVGFGTSLPELVTSLRAALIGAPGIAWGNIVGSNIANILLIGGISALLFPIAVSRAGLRRDASVMVATAVAFALLAASAGMGRLPGVLCLAGLATYIALVYRQERNTPPPEESPAPPAPLLFPLLMATAGLALIITGGGLLVSGAVEIARTLQISESTIGLTLVAVGTSLPELVTSVIAALRRQGDVAFGNIVGSNIYNILGIGGITALIAPSDLPPRILAVDTPAMLVVSLLFLVFAATRLRIARAEGAVLLAGYTAYIGLMPG